MPSQHEQLTDLAHYLNARRAVILRAWRAAVSGDPALTAASALSRTQFYDHIPEVLDGFERRLSAQQDSDAVKAAQAQSHGAAEHGLHRWQQGYDQFQTMREWSHLQLCLLNELETFSAQRGLADDVMPTARRALTQLCGDGMSESAAQYARLQQTEAASRVLELERALAKLSELDRERAEAWREVAHDLRGSVGAIRNASAIVSGEQTPEAMRTRFAQSLERQVAWLHELLDELISLARLEAGHEMRRIEAFDAAHMLQELAATLQPLALERGLFLHTTGPAVLPVEGDLIKVRRVAQNLLLNALKYTERGGVRLGWSVNEAGAALRWQLYVQDTGPGIYAGAEAPLERALRDATEEAQQVEDKAAPTVHSEPAPTLASQSRPGPHQRSAGEGVGLVIVKRLSELLDASLELETSAGQGTTFRVIFPRRYGAERQS